jgi:hypothetical protein
MIDEQKAERNAKKRASRNHNLSHARASVAANEGFHISFTIIIFTYNIWCMSQVIIFAYISVCVDGTDVTCLMHFVSVRLNGCLVRLNNI